MEIKGLTQIMNLCTRNKPMVPVIQGQTQFKQSPFITASTVTAFKS